MPQMTKVGLYAPIQPQYGDQPAVYRDNVSTTIYSGMPVVTASTRRSGSNRANRGSLKIQIPLWNSTTATFTDKMICSVDMVFPDSTNDSDRENLIAALLATLNNAPIKSSFTGLNPLTM